MNTGQPGGMPLSFLLLIDSVMGALVGACGKSRRADSAPRVGAHLDSLIWPYGVKGPYADPAVAGGGASAFAISFSPSSRA